MSISPYLTTPLSTAARASHSARVSVATGGVATSGNRNQQSLKTLRLRPKAQSSANSVPSTTRMAPTPSVSERDAHLFAAIQADETDWKRMLFEQYVGLVRGLLIRCMGPQLEVDDLSAEVFVGLFESARNIRSAEGMRSYIVSVTMNTARREFRRRKRRNLLFFRDDPDELVERTAGTDDPKAKAALLQLSKILEELTTEERLVFALHILDEIPLGKAAADLGISLSTARRRLKKAQERVHRRVLKNPLLADYIREKARSSARPRPSSEAPVPAADSLCAGESLGAGESLRAGESLGAGNSVDAGESVAAQVVEEQHMLVAEEEDEPASSRAFHCRPTTLGRPAGGDDGDV